MCMNNTYINKNYGLSGEGRAKFDFPDSDFRKTRNSLHRLISSSEQSWVLTLYCLGSDVKHFCICDLRMASCRPKIPARPSYAETHLIGIFHAAELTDQLRAEYRVERKSFLDGVSV